MKAENTAHVGQVIVGLEKVAAFTEEGPKGLVSTSCWPDFPGDGDLGWIQPQSTTMPLLKIPAAHMERRY